MSHLGRKNRYDMGGCQRTLIFEKKKTVKVVIFNCIRKRKKEETCSLADYLPAGVLRPEETEYRMRRSGKTLSFTLGHRQAQERGRSSDDCCWNSSLERRKVNA